MTLYQLECFVQVAELLSFVRAAEQMCISQPAITYQIRTLEKEMDVTLFERSTRHCRLTPAGQAFYHDAIQLISFYQRAVKNAREIQRTNNSHLRVGIRKFFDYDRMTELVEHFYQKHSSSRIDILPQNDGKQLDDLRSGHIDIGFFYSCEHEECFDITFKPLYELNYYVLMKAEHPFSSKESLTMADLKGHRIANSGANTDFLAAVQKPVIIDLIKAGADLTYSSSSFESALIMVRSQKGLLVLPMLASTEVPGMIKVPLIGCPTVRMEIGWMKQDNRTEIQDFVSFAKNLYKEL